MIISFIGVDGTGKSTTINKVFHYIEESNRPVYIKYMGNHNWETRIAQKFSDKKYRTIFGQFIQMIIRYCDMYIRMSKYNKKHILLTDRYPLMSVIISNKTRRIQEFSYSFLPEPDIIVYLYAEVKTSIEREKREVDKDKKKLITMSKKKLDDVFLENKEDNVLTYNVDKMTAKEVAEDILSHITYNNLYKEISM